ncbi:MAG TPA: sulfite exporter TauE/SafE family protein [Stellaceae bacterium]|nr:sulfite exporter TauE/SafE family protein [Stellaceae bacterium]
MSARSPVLSATTTPHVLVCILGIFVAGGVSGATGVALPLIAGPLFLLTYSPVEAVALTALCSITGQLFSIALLRRAIAFEFRVPLLASGLLGVPLGGALLTRLAPSVVHYGLGALIVLGSAWGLLQPTARHPRPATVAGELLVGLTGGLTAGLVGASAVVPAVWCAWRGLSKEQQRAMMQPYILAMQLASLVSLTAWGSLGAPLLDDYTVVLMPLMIGVGCGVACFHFFSSAMVTRAVLLFVAVSGLVLLFA